MENIKNLKAEAAEIAAVAKNGEASEEQLTRMTEITTKLENYKTQAEAAARAIELSNSTDVVETKAVETNSLGEKFVRSTVGAARTRSEKVESSFELRAITSTSIVTNPTLYPVAAPAPRAPLAGAINIERVSTGSVDYVVEDVTYSADVVVEGQLKPESTITFTPNAVTLDTIAHSIDVTRQALEDESRLQGIIDGALRNGLVKKSEENIALAITSNASILEVQGSSLLDAIRFAMANVESNDFTPNTVIVNPFDLAALDVEVAGSFREVSTNNTLWGLNVISSTNVSAGTAFVGDLASAVTWFDRGTAAVYTTDSDADKFRRNIITILAETRAKAAVVRPAALAKATVFTPEV